MSDVHESVRARIRRGDMPMTAAATQRALRRVAQGETPYSAARAENIALSTIYRALKRLSD